MNNWVSNRGSLSFTKQAICSSRVVSVKPHCARELQRKYYLPVVLLFTMTTATIVDGFHNLAKAATMSGAIGTVSDLRLGEVDRGSRVYAGFGFGSSWLTPDTSSVAGVDSNDRLQGAGQIMLGYDVNRWLSVEAHSADLGKAGFNNGATISYKEVGGSALFYLGGARGRFHRQGVTAFGRLGLGYLSTSGSPGLAHEKENNLHVLFGAGVEYMSQRGLGFRAEGISFERDASYGQMSLLYRFGGQSQSRTVISVVEKPLLEVSAVAAKEVSSKKVIAPVLHPEPLAAAASVGLRESVFFASGSAQLDRSSRQTLAEIAAMMIDNPDTFAALSAHTDSVGNVADNRQLSKKRAHATSAYLISLGVPKSRLRASAMGELVPVHSNTTTSGRNSNRRVEVIVAPE